jgi:hypothetical protein
VAGAVDVVAKVATGVAVVAVAAGRAAGSHPHNPRFAWHMSALYGPGRGVADSRAPVFLRVAPAWSRW